VIAGPRNDGHRADRVHREGAIRQRHVAEALRAVSRQSCSGGYPGLVVLCPSFRSGERSGGSRSGIYGAVRKTWSGLDPHSLSFQ